MQKYRVTLYEECGGRIWIEAKDKAQAREKAIELVSDDGIDGTDGSDITYRNYEVLNITEE